MFRARPSRTGHRPASFEPLERRALMSAAVDLTIADAGFSDAANQPAAIPGARFYICPTIQENGLAPTRALPYSIYLSPGPSLTDQSIRIYSRADGDFATWSGPTWTAEATGTLPGGVTPGTWYPIVIVDPDNVIPESNETNNTLVGDPVTVTLPQDDLVAPTPSAPTIWPAGTSMNVFTDFRAVERLYPITVAYSLSIDNVAGNADDIPLAAFTVNPNACWLPGAPMLLGYFSGDGYNSVPLPADLPPGTYHIVTTVDPDHAIADPDTTNNAAVGPAITILPAGTIDLTAWAPNLGPSPFISPNVPRGTFPTPGSTISIGTYPYSKFGQAARPKVAFVLSSDDTYGNDDDVLLGSYDADATTPTPPGLIVCFAFPTTLDVTLPSTLAPGQYKLFAVVDPDNQLPEYDESNNVSVGTDLTIVAGTPTDDQPPFVSDPPATSPNTPTGDKPIQETRSTPTFRNITAGSSAKTSVTLTNPTGKSLTAAYKVTFYLSTDPTLSLADQLIATQTLTVTLRPHQTKSTQLTYKIPASTKSGLRYLITTLTPLRNTRITTQSSPTPLNILPKASALKSLPISKQILESRADR